MVSLRIKHPSLFQSLDLYLLSSQPVKRKEKNLVCWQRFKTTTIIVQQLHGCCGSWVAQSSEQPEKAFEKKQQKEQMKN